MISQDWMKKKVSEYFTWGEMLYLHEWQIYALPDAQVKSNLVHTCLAANNVRRIIGEPMRVTSGWRPPAYNKYIGGAAASYHTRGMAMDFKVVGRPAGDIRELLRPHLEILGLRMENKPGSNWVHIDTMTPGLSGRYFKP